MEISEKKLALNLELVVTTDNKVNIAKCVTNDWPAKLLLAVMGAIDEKIGSYYSKSGDYEICAVIDTLTNEHEFSGRRSECLKYVIDHPESSYLSVIP